jgi:hypothetical protein
MKVWFLRFFVVLFLLKAEDRYLTTKPEEVNVWFIIFEVVSAFGEFVLS